MRKKFLTILIQIEDTIQYFDRSIR